MVKGRSGRRVWGRSVLEEILNRPCQFWVTHQTWNKQATRRQITTTFPGSSSILNIVVSRWRSICVSKEPGLGTDLSQQTRMAPHQ